MNYEHKQIGYLMIYTWVFVASLFSYILYSAPYDLPLTIFIVIILFVLLSFNSLHVKIDQEFIHIKFGFGIFQKKFPLNEITSAKAVKNKWYHGWGIRWWLWPKMWIFNVSGFDAVEIITKDNKIYRIGTDEPQQLEYALKQVIK